MNKMPRLAQVIRGIKADQARSPSASRAKRLPITLALLRKMKKSWQEEENRWNSTMLWAGAFSASSGQERSPRSQLSPLMRGHTLPSGCNCGLPAGSSCTHDQTEDV